MAIKTDLQPKYKWKILIIAVVCLGLGIWGYYDWTITVPNRWATYEEFQELTARLAEIEETVSEGFVSESDLPNLAAERDEIEVRLAELGTVERPAVYDEHVQLWLYVVGCGLLGAPYFFYLYFAESRRIYRMDDDGTLHLPGGETWTPNEIADIDMNRWMKKSIAYVIHQDGRRVKLDDYKHRNLHLIIGAIAHRFYPDKWTPDARVVPRSAPETEPLAEPDAVSERKSQREDEADTYRADTSPAKGGDSAD